MAIINALPESKEYAVMTGATGSTGGSSGLVPAPAAGDNDKCLKGDGTWGTVSSLPAVTSGDNGKVLKVVSGDWSVENEQSISGKADIVTGGTEDNFVSLTSNGNIQDSGKKAADFKTAQTAVSDPSASGTSITFIDSISQNTNGVITATKKTVSTMNGATGSTGGSAGLVPAPSSTDNTKFLKGDGAWAATPYPSVMTGADGTTAGASGLTPAPAATDNTKFLKGNGTWAEVPNPSVMTGATGTTGGTSGLVPAPAATDNVNFLRGDGTWAAGGKPMVILSYGNSTWNDFISAYSDRVIVYCRASSNSNPATGSQNRMAFMAYVNDATSPTEVEFQYYRSVATHSVSQQGDQVFVYKLNSSGTWSVTTREAASKIVAGTNLSSSYSSGTLTISGNYSTFGGATGTTGGSAGLVPAPAATDNTMYLKGDGTWGNPPGSKLIVVDLDTVTNTSGSYTHTTTISGITADMKAIKLELGDPSVFKSAINITTADNAITLSCSSVEGTSTVRVSLMFVAGANSITSSDFDVLAARIGSLSSLTTTDQTSVVDAINEVNGKFDEIETLYRQYWDNTSEVSVDLDDDGKTYVIWSAGSSAGTLGAMMDSTYGSVIIVSNGQYAVMHKGSGITVTAGDGELTVSASTGIQMAVIEL